MIGTNDKEIQALLPKCFACGGDHDPAIADAVHKQIIDDLKAKLVVTEDKVTIIHSKVIGFHHRITHGQVVLECDPKKPTRNALGQMHDRIREGLEEIFK